MSPLPFIDLAAQQRRIRERIEARLRRVLDHGQYIFGPEVGELEEALAAFCGARHAIACGNGTDALQLAMMALGIGPGDAVIVPSFTFVATAETVALVGATPVFADIDPESYNLSAASLERAVARARAEGLRPRAVIPVDLFGLPADYDALEPVAAAAGLRMICDTAQGFGASYRGRRTGAIGDLATTSFFPAKPLGAYGDGGAVFTSDDGLAELVRSLRNHGAGSHRYENVRIGMNSRLDSFQAAVLLEKLAIFPEEIELRQQVAQRYAEGLADVVEVPRVPEGSVSVWAQYTVRTRPGQDREAIMAALREAGIPSVIYYPLPLHRQKGYAHFPADPEGLPATEEAAERVFSLPMHPYLSAEDQARIIEALRAAVR